MFNPRKNLQSFGLKKPEIKIVVEKKNRGIGWLLFAEDVKSGSRTYAGAAMSQDTLEYNVRKAKMKFGIPID